MKAKVIATGEIIEVNFELSVSPNNMGYIYKDDDGRIFHHNELDFDFVCTPIDWEQRRYEIAKVVVQAIWANSAIDIPMTEMAELAIEQADVLIKKLKGES